MPSNSGNAMMLAKLNGIFNSTVAAQVNNAASKSGTNTSDSETPTLNAVQIKSQSPVKQLESQQKFQQQNQIEASEVQEPSIEQPALP